MCMLRVKFMLALQELFVATGEVSDKKRLIRQICDHQASNAVLGEEYYLYVCVYYTHNTMKCYECSGY